MTDDRTVDALIAAAEGHAVAGRPGTALALLREGLRSRRDDLRLLFATGTMALRAGVPDEAVALLRVVSQRLPGMSAAAVAYARALCATGRPALAERVAREGLRADSASLPLRDALARALADQLDHDGACAVYEEIHALRPDDPGPMAGLAEAHAHAGRYAAAMAWYARAIAAAPESGELRLSRATVRLAAGDAPGGWADWDARLAPGRGRAVVRDHRLPRWDGAPVEGGLLVEAEQGIGEQVLFAACLPATAARVSGPLVLECHPRLVPLLRRSFPAWSVHPFDQRDEGPPPVFGYGWLADAPAVDCHAEIGSLPGLLGLGLATPPVRSAYLIPDPARRDALRARYRSLGPGPIVGLTWRSRNRIHGQAKNLEIADVAAIVRARPDAVFVSLQYGAHQGDREALERLGARIHVDRDVDALSDLDAHLAQIAAVDVVVGASNTALHLAAAVGRPVWVLAPRGRGLLWYWGDAGETARWYAGVRAFRQSADGSWAEAVAAVIRDLRAIPSLEGGNGSLFF
jgi:tetratricopeptide (TPR) repeat protein